MISLMRFASIAAATILLSSAPPASAQSNKSWDGLWTGVQGKAHAAPIELSIVDGKVVGYRLKGAAFDVQYSSVTPTTVSFGDRDHYIVDLMKTSDTTAAGHIRGRDGIGAVSLTKQ